MRSRRRRLAEITFKNENKVQLINERAEEATVAELCERGVGEAEGMEGRRGQERRRCRSVSCLLLLYCSG